MKTIWILLGFILLMSCSYKSSIFFRNTRKGVACTNDWVFSDLEKRDTIKLLYYRNESEYGLYFSSCIAIGVNTENDTVGYTDYTHRGVINAGATVYVEPFDWGDELKKFYIPGKPTDYNRLKRKEVRMYCSFKDIKYCKFSGIIE